MSGKRLYIVIPCYNEEEVLQETARQVLHILQDMIQAMMISEESRILFVNDGSQDRTWQIITELHKQNQSFSGLSLSRNMGHQKALLAGLFFAKEHADMVISMDADLQDDVNAVKEMVEQYNHGIEIVYGIRSSRVQDSLFKRVTAKMFYRILTGMGVEIIPEHADFRLMSKRALEGLALFHESNLFLRGIVPMIGFKTATVSYARKKRFAGISKYPLKKMLSFAWEGITSLSILPMRWITIIGFSVFILSMCMLIYAFVSRFAGTSVIGWTSVICSIWAIGGLMLLSLGVIGEYIGKMYLETKARPRYIISEILDSKHKT